ncbi:hypothetical protein MMC30_007231 [Trapelia coarctata]|nr:hypothetical protein [Trapelia coarctata]
MTDLLHILPDFPVTGYTHLIPSLEKHLITCADLLTLEAPEVAKRAQLPPHDVRKLADDILARLQGQLGLSTPDGNVNEETNSKGKGKGTAKEESHIRKLSIDLAKQWHTISTLDDKLDSALGGGIPTGFITELTGESGAGKTQLLLTLLLSAQLPPPHGLARPTLYISTEHPLPTTRLSQLLSTHPILTSASPPPSLSRILTLQTPDLESQDHILTYQLPVVLARHSPALIIIDSIAANYRAETSSLTTTPSTPPAALAQRSTDLIRLGHLLRSLACEFNCAIVVANQVSDRFAPTFAPNSSQHLTQRNRLINQDAYSPSPAPSTPSSDPGPLSPTAHAPSSVINPAPTSIPPPTVTTTPTATLLTLDHQQRFFTGWGDSPPSLPRLQHQHPANQNLKTPSLGLIWANQITCRVALVKEPAYQRQLHLGQEGLAVSDGVREGIAGAEWAPRRFRRWMRVVFAPWVGGVSVGERGVEFEIWRGGVRAIRAEGEKGGERE